MPAAASRYAAVTVPHASFSSYISSSCLVITSAMLIYIEYIISWSQLLQPARCWAPRAEARLICHALLAAAPPPEHRRTRYGHGAQKSARDYFARRLHASARLPMDDWAPLARRCFEHAPRPPPKSTRAPSFTTIRAELRSTHAESHILFTKKMMLIYAFHREALSLGRASRYTYNVNNTPHFRPRESCMRRCIAKELHDAADKYILRYALRK